MAPHLSRAGRLGILAELCPKGGARRPCDSSEIARENALGILGPADRTIVTADYVLMRAVDRYMAGEIDAADLYRCRVLAYYMTFASGGEEWGRWGVVASVRPGDFEELPDEADLDTLLPPAPQGPPWLDGNPDTE